MSRYSDSLSDRNSGTYTISQGAFLVITTGIDLGRIFRDEK